LRWRSQLTSRAPFLHNFPPSTAFLPRKRASSLRTCFLFVKNAKSYQRTSRRALCLNILHPASPVSSWNGPAEVRVTYRNLRSSASYLVGGEDSGDFRDFAARPAAGRLRSLSSLVPSSLHFDSAQGKGDGPISSQSWPLPCRSVRKQRLKHRD
jgi:hypothetical protein